MSVSGWQRTLLLLYHKKKRRPRWPCSDDIEMVAASGIQCLIGSSSPSGLQRLQGVQGRPCTQATQALWGTVQWERLAVLRGAVEVIRKESECGCFSSL